MGTLYTRLLRQVKPAVSRKKRNGGSTRPSASLPKNAETGASHYLGSRWLRKIVGPHWNEMCAGIIAEGIHWNQNRPVKLTARKPLLVDIFDRGQIESAITEIAQK